MSEKTKLEAALHEADIYGIGATSDTNQRVILEAARTRLRAERPGWREGIEAAAKAEGGATPKDEGAGK